MSRETVLRQYVDSVEQDYDYMQLDLPSLAGDAGHQRPVRVRLCSCPRPGGLPDSGGHGGACRRGAEHQGQINPKLKIGGMFFLNDFGKEQFAWTILFAILYTKEMVAHAKTISGRI